MDLSKRIQKTFDLPYAVEAFGVAGYSPLVLSKGLSSLGLCHDLCFYQDASFKYKTQKVKSVHDNLPSTPVVLAGLDCLAHYRPTNERHTLFICDAAPRLQCTNLKGMPVDDGTLVGRLKASLLSPFQETVKVHLDEPGLLDYVAEASRPSVLRSIQTLLYKVNPYALRLQIQAAIFTYLAGGSYAKVKGVLGLHVRGKEFRTLLGTDAAQILVQAVKESKNLSDRREIADKYGLDVFDLNYVAARATKEADDGKKIDTPNRKRGASR